MFKKTTSSSDKTGLENKTESVGPKMVERRPSVFKIPKNLFLLVETQSARKRFYDAIEEVKYFLRMRNKSIDPYFKNKLYSQIDAGKTVLAEYQHKLNELVSICSDSCKDIDELTEDLSAYKKKFIMVKEECMCFLPEGTPSMSSPPVAKSQPSTAEKEEIISSRAGSVPSMEEAYNLDSLFTVVCHSEEHNMTPAMDGEDEIYNLESLFAGVSPPEKQRTDLEAESPSDAVMTPDIDGIEKQATPKGESGSHDLAEPFADVSHAVRKEIQLEAGIASLSNQADVSTNDGAGAEGEDEAAPGEAVDSAANEAAGEPNISQSSSQEIPAEKSVKEKAEVMVVGVSENITEVVSKETAILQYYMEKKRRASPLPVPPRPA